MNKHQLNNIARLMLDRIRKGDRGCIDDFEVATGIAAQFADIHKCRLAVAKMNGFKNWVEVPR